MQTKAWLATKTDDSEVKQSMILSSQLRVGMAIGHQGQPYKVVAAEYHPGQGKMGGVTHARLQNLDTSTFWAHSFRADLRFEEIALEKQTLEYLYAHDNQCYFMNPETFEQREVAKALVGRQVALLESGMKVVVEFAEGRATSVVFPEILELKVAETAPPAHQQQDSTFKPARLTNGIEVMVPQFIKAGDVIRLDVQNPKYMERAKPEGKGKSA
jgi:elongation factor P